MGMEFPSQKPSAWKQQVKFGRVGAKPVGGLLIKKSVTLLRGWLRASSPLVDDSVCSGQILKSALLVLLLQETESDFDNCAVCIEGYKPNDVVRILPCR